MSKIYLAGLLFISMLLSNAIAQDVGEMANQSSEFLTPVAPQERANLINSNRLDYAEFEYFAKPGRVDVFKFDIAALEKEGTTVTITPFGGESVSILSHGFERNPKWRGRKLRWHGEMQTANSEEGVPVVFDVIVRSVDAKGNVRPPDPNREATLRELENETHTVLAESAARIDERLIYSLSTNFLYLPDQDMTLGFSHLGKQFDAMVVWEPDNFRIAPPDTIAIRGEVPKYQQNAESRRQAETVRAQKEFEDYMEGIRQEIESTQNQE
jgi:hypothetical protein